VDYTREHTLEAIIVDLTSGPLMSWQGIKSVTGLSEERCKELEREVDEVCRVYYERNRIS
jgi:hypothetical protein